MTTTYFSTISIISFVRRVLFFVFCVFFLRMNKDNHLFSNYIFCWKLFIKALFFLFLEDTRVYQQRISNKKLNKLMVDFRSEVEEKKYKEKVEENKK
ncbi:unnamed protein product, partial [Vitis vinifera]